MRDSSIDGSSQAALNISARVTTVGPTPDYAAMIREAELLSKGQQYGSKTPGVPTADGIKNKYGADFTIPELPAAL